MLLIKLFVIIVLSVILAILSNKIKFKNSLLKDIIVLSVTSLAAFGSTEILDLLDRAFNIPSVIVVTKKTANEINIELKVRRSITLFSINYPVRGKIINYQDLNSINDAYTSVSRVIGDTSFNAPQNNLEISTTVMKPSVRINYKVIYQPTKSTMFIAGMDRYQYSYMWEHNGKKFYKSEWRFVDNDFKATAPDVYTIGTTFYNKVLTPEGANKIYKEGPPKKKLK
jgi:hypothetical protein